jgi:hypothetical protein
MSNKRRKAQQRSYIWLTKTKDQAAKIQVKAGILLQDEVVVLILGVEDLLPTVVEASHP